MLRCKWQFILLAATLLSVCVNANAGGSFGIDHQVNYDNAGIWKRSNQTALLDLLLVGEVVGGVWVGGETRLGKTLWRSIDSSALAGISAQVLKLTFTRARPDQTNDPNQWFKGGSHYSFPSGEVAAISAVVTPFILEYRDDHPVVYALELLPIYESIARVKVRAHWQSDVLAGFALGTLTGYYAHNRDSPFILSVLPRGVSIGFHKNF